MLYTFSGCTAKVNITPGKLFSLTKDHQPVIVIVDSEMLCGEAGIYLLELYDGCEVLGMELLQLFFNIF